MPNPINFRARMVAWLGTLRARRRYGIQHVPSYRSNPPRPTSGVRRVWRDQCPRHRTAEGTGIRQEIADQGVTRCDRFVPDRSYFKPHRTQCSAILTTFTPRFFVLSSIISAEV